jgi:hypothetical protein
MTARTERHPAAPNDGNAGKEPEGRAQVNAE